MAHDFRAGVTSSAQAGQDGVVRASACIALDEEPGSTHRWRLEIWVASELEGSVLLGTIETQAVGANPPGRIVAICSAPGAEVWSVYATCLDGAGEARETAKCRMYLSPEPLGCCAIQPLNGSVDVSPEPEDEEGGGDV